MLPEIGIFLVVISFTPVDYMQPTRDMILDQIIVRVCYKYTYYIQEMDLFENIRKKHNLKTSSPREENLK